MSSADFEGFSSFADANVRRHTKIFWGVVLTTCLVITTFHCTKTITSYIDNPVASSVFIKHEFEARLPQIMIQSTVSWNFTKLRKDGFEERLFPDLVKALFARELPPDVEVPSSKAEWPERFDKMDTVNFMLEYGYGCEETLLYCSFNFNKFNCCDKAVPYWHMMYGTSQILQDLPSQRRINSRDGLFVIIRWDEQMYLDFRNFALNPLYKAYRVDIGDDFNYPPVDSTTLLPLGMFTQIRITAKKTKRIKGMKVHCLENVSEYNPAQIYRDLCPSITFDKMCKCANFAYLKNSSRTLCDIRALGSCFEDNFDATFSECNAANFQPLELCEILRYQTSLNSAPLEPYTVASMIGVNGSSMNTNHYVVAFIQYSLIGQTIEEVRDSQSLEGLIALLGGELGLWLGCSIISIIQVVLFLGHQIHKLCCKTLERKTKVEYPII